MHLCCLEVPCVHGAGGAGRVAEGEAAAAAIARRQQGVVSVAQLIAAGLSRRAIQHRARCGRLHRLHRGVYAVGHRAITIEGRWMAAVLAYGPGSLLSHRDAAALWGILERIERPIDVLVSGRHRPRRGLAPHHTAAVHPDDRTERLGIPVTGVARTLLDLCDVAPRRRVQRAFKEADRLQLLDWAGLAALRGPAAVLRSPLEQRFLALCREAGLPEPETSARIAGREVDMLWRQAGVVVELDGYSFHRGRGGFERDRRRDASCSMPAYSRSESPSGASRRTPPEVAAVGACSPVTYTRADRRPLLGEAAAC